MKHVEKQIIELLSEVLKVTKSLVRQQAPARPTTKPVAKSGVRGIHPHQSKYNPWRAYVWNTTTRKTAYLGAFPTIAKAKAAQRDYRAGQPVASGTRTNKLQLVA
jgi:hypothetical protein